MHHLLLSTGFIDHFLNIFQVVLVIFPYLAGSVSSISLLKFGSIPRVGQVQLGSADGPSFAVGVAALELLGDEDEEDEDPQTPRPPEIPEREPMASTEKMRKALGY